MKRNSKKKREAITNETNWSCWPANSIGAPQTWHSATSFPSRGTSPGTEQPSHEKLQSLMSKSFSKVLASLHPTHSNQVVIWAPEVPQICKPSNSPIPIPRKSILFHHFWISLTRIGKRLRNDAKRRIDMSTEEGEGDRERIIEQKAALNYGSKAVINHNFQG